MTREATDLAASVYQNKLLFSQFKKASKHKQKMEKFDRLFYSFFYLSVVLNIVGIFFIYFTIGVFLMGSVMVAIITIINVSIFTIKKCIFEKALSKDERYITLHWCCGLTIGKRPLKQRKLNGSKK